MSIMLQIVFEKLCNKYSNAEITAKLWIEIVNAYSQPIRHYHTLTHLENIHRHLNAIKAEIKNWDAVLFALFYHDFIYKPTKNDNEERSAEVASKRLMQIKAPNSTVLLVEQMITATKSHSKSNIEDVNLFTDADLSILGEPWSVYYEYMLNVRKEFKMFPNLIYKPGRKKVIDHFLSMPSIYKTHHFVNLFEQSARENLQRERNS